MKKIDLHCHTTASDGTLSPLQLYNRAHEQGVTLLAITDHDTIAGYEYLSNTTTLPSGPQLISGIELSTTWSNIEIHIVGVNFPTNHPDLTQIIREQGEARHQRALHIAKRLACRLNQRLTSDALFNAVLDQAKITQQVSQDNFQLPDTRIQLGRPHFAAWLKNKGLVNSAQDAFKKYLTNNKLGNIRAFWPAMTQRIACIRALGGTPILAHPGKYGLTRTKLSALIVDFKYAGGQALEVIGCNTPHSQIQQLADFCKRYDLKASQGSDFHSPDNPWIELGRLPCLPKNLTPIWDSW